MSGQISRASGLRPLTVAALLSLNRSDDGLIREAAHRLALERTVLWVEEHRDNGELLTEFVTFGGLETALGFIFSPLPPREPDISWSLCGAIQIAIRTAQTQCGRGVLRDLRRKTCPFRSSFPFKQLGVASEDLPLDDTGAESSLQRLVRTLELFAVDGAKELLSLYALELLAGFVTDEKLRSFPYQASSEGWFAKLLKRAEASRLRDGVTSYVYSLFWQSTMSWGKAPPGAMVEMLTLFIHDVVLAAGRSASLDQLFIISEFMLTLHTTFVQQHLAQHLFPFPSQRAAEEKKVAGPLHLCDVLLLLIAALSHSGGPETPRVDRLKAHLRTLWTKLPGQKLALASFEGWAEAVGVPGGAALSTVMSAALQVGFGLPLNEPPTQVVAESIRTAGHVVVLQGKPAQVCCNNTGTCSSKQQTGPTGTAVVLKRCGRCRHAWYCSKGCQRAHWSRHKRICGIWEFTAETGTGPTLQFQEGLSSSFVGIVRA